MRGTKLVRQQCEIGVGVFARYSLNVSVSAPRIGSESGAATIGAYVNPRGFGNLPASSRHELADHLVEVAQRAVVVAGFSGGEPCEKIGAGSF